jgi:hypothetical protein
MLKTLGCPILSTEEKTRLMARMPWFTVLPELYENEK